MYLLILVSPISEPGMLSSLFSSSENCTGESGSGPRKMCRPSFDSVSVPVFPSNGLLSRPNLLRLGITYYDHRSSDLSLYHQDVAEYASYSSVTYCPVFCSPVTTVLSFLLVLTSQCCLLHMFHLSCLALPLVFSHAVSCFPLSSESHPCMFQ